MGRNKSPKKVHHWAPWKFSVLRSNEDTRFADLPSARRAGGCAACPGSALEKVPWRSDSRRKFVRMPKRSLDSECILRNRASSGACWWNRVGRGVAEADDANPGCE